MVRISRPWHILQTLARKSWMCPLQSICNKSKALQTCLHHPFDGLCVHSEPMLAQHGDLSSSSSHIMSRGCMVCAACASFAALAEHSHPACVLMMVWTFQVYGSLDENTNSFKCLPQKRTGLQCSKAGCQLWGLPWATSFPWVFERDPKCLLFIQP